LRDRPVLRLGLALITVVSVLGILDRRAPIQDLHGFDQTYYLGIAYDLRHVGRYTDGYVYATPAPDGTRPPGMRFAPLYPAVLAVAATLDPSFDHALSCVVEHPPGYVCPRSAPLVRMVQFALLCGFYLLLWWITQVVSGSRRVGWFALILGLFAAPALMGGVNYLMTENVTLFLVTAATAAAVRATVSVRRGFCLGLAGALLGLVALTRPAFEYLFLASAAVGVVLALLHANRRRGLVLAVSFVVGGCMVMLPWIVRNELVLSRPALSFGYASEVLVQRIAFDQMDWAEFGKSFICWLPDGSGMGTLLWGPGACARFQLEPRADTFYWIGNTTLMDSTIAAAGGLTHHLGYLVRTYIIPELPWHVMISIPMALHGISINHYWGLVLAFVCAAVTWRALRTGDRRVLIVTLPGWFMLAFHAACAVNQVRYNLMLVVPFSLAGGLALDHAWTRWVRMPFVVVTTPAD
jgi:hypothetical protein